MLQILFLSCVNNGTVFRKLQISNIHIGKEIVSKKQFRSKGAAWKDNMTWALQHHDKCQYGWCPNLKSNTSTESHKCLFRNLQGCMCEVWVGTAFGTASSEGDELHYLLFSVPNHNQSLTLPRQPTTGVQSPHKHKHTHKFKHSVFRYSNTQRLI